MKKRTRNIWIGLLSATLVLSLGAMGVIQYRYWKLERGYGEAVDKFVSVPQTGTLKPQPGEPSSSNEGPTVIVGDPAESTEPRGPVELAPIAVDFEALREVAPDIVGWIYCEGTVINYPVVQGEDNEQYLHHQYDGKYNYGGSIFVESMNRRDFQDFNTILYGHNMNNGSMFGTLSKWTKQAYFDEHPVFWLLTPEQDYRVELLGSAVVSAYSETYTVFQEPGEALDNYLAKQLSKPLVRSDVDPEEGAKYVVFSTCAYWFENARYVLYGMLVPLDSAGGTLLATKA